MRRDEARWGELGEIRRDEAGWSESGHTGQLLWVVWLLVLHAHEQAAQAVTQVSFEVLWLLTATLSACAGRGECVRAHCGCARLVRVVAGLLLLMGSVLCVQRCAGVRRARAVRVCVLGSRVRLRVLRARRCVL